MTAVRLYLAAFALLLRVSQALLLAPHPSDVAACIGTACLGATLALGDAAYAADTINARESTIDKDLPSLIRSVRDNRQTLSSSIRQLTGPSEALQQVYSPAIKVRTPTDIRGTIQSPLLPQFSFSQSASTTVMAQAPPFGDRPFSLLPIPNQYQFTSKNVVGGSALALGALYAVSYGYYQNAILQEEAEARKRKEAMAAKREAAAAAKEAAAEEVLEVEEEVVEDMEEEEQEMEEEEAIVEEVPVAVTVPPLSPEEELALEKARAAVEKAKRSGLNAMTTERNRKVNEEELESDSETSVIVQEDEEDGNDDDDEPPLKRKPLWKFWRWMKRNYGE